MTVSALPIRTHGSHDDIKVRFETCRKYCLCTNSEVLVNVCQVKKICFSMFRNKKKSLLPIYFMMLKIICILFTLK